MKKWIRKIFNNIYWWWESFREWKLKPIYWWFVHRLCPYHQYHVVRTSLKPGYHGFLVRMVYSTFDDFVRWYSYSREYYEIGKDIKAKLDEILDWWNEKKYYDRLDDLDDLLISKEINFDKYDREWTKLNNKVGKYINTIWKYHGDIDT